MSDDQATTAAPDDTRCCGQQQPGAWAPKKGAPRNNSCALCPNSPNFWNRTGDADLRPLGER